MREACGLEGVPETDHKECVFVWEKGPRSGVSCSSSDSAVSQRGCSSSLDLCFAACEMGVILVPGAGVALREWSGAQLMGKLIHCLSTFFYHGTGRAGL